MSINTISENKLVILRLCHEPRRLVDISSHMNISQRNVIENLKALARQGLITKTEDGRYVITEKGLEVINDIRRRENEHWFSKLLKSLFVKEKKPSEEKLHALHFFAGYLLLIPSLSLVLKYAEEAYKTPIAEYGKEFGFKESARTLNEFIPFALKLSRTIDELKTYLDFKYKAMTGEYLRKILRRTIEDRERKFDQKAESLKPEQRLGFFVISVEKAFDLIITPNFNRFKAAFKDPEDKTFVSYVELVMKNIYELIETTKALYNTYMKEVEKEYKEFEKKYGGVEKAEEEIDRLTKKSE
jgi:predicted transcriptional regulator